MTSVYDLSPKVHGTFDVVLFPGVLYHLRHPLLALDRIHAVCGEFAFVETHVLDDDLIHGGERHRLASLHPLLAQTPLLQFYPGDELGGDASNWFAANIAGLKAMLATSGFRPRLAGRWADRASFMARRQDFEQPLWY